MKQYLPIIFLLLTFCGPSEQEIKAYIDSSIEEAVQAEQEIKAYIDSSVEEAVNEIQKKTSIENQNFQNENVKSDFLVWGSDYFESILDIGYVNEDDDYIGLGTGAIITPDGYVITNFHVAVGVQNFSLFNYSEYDPALNSWIDPKTNKEPVPLSAEWVAGSMCYDLALLKIDSNENFSSLDWYGDFIPGLEIYTLGYPSVGQGEITVSNGVVSSLRYFGDTRWTAPGLQTFGHTAPIFFGNSGSPVLSEDGKIVGINYTAYKEQDEEFSISYAINNQIAEQVVDNYLINGIDYENIGVFGAIDNVSFYLPQGDDRNLPFYYIYDVHPGSFAEKALIEKDELLFFFGDYYVGKSDFSDIGVDGAPMLTDLCSLISEWENSDKQNIELTLYSCYYEEFYVATLSKTDEIFDAYFIDNPFNNFSNEEIDEVCYSNF